MLILIKGGRVICPGKIDSVADILIKDGIIHKINGLCEQTKADIIIDATGKIVVPGLIDMHVHLREPGFEYKETIKTGCLSAAAGGFTAICSMPNTNPVNDNRQVTEYILKQAEKADSIRVYPVAAISPGLKGNGICEYGDLKGAGAVAISDDGNPVMNGQVMRRALEYAKGFNLPVISHCEDLNLSGSGVINEGSTATRMGLAGIPCAAETVMVMRDIELCRLTKGKLHIAHVSTKESVAAIRDAKKRGILVTAETAPHYFMLTQKAVESYNTCAKMNPPLRSDEDRRAIIEGLADGTIDVIATDHAPHSSIEKEIEFDMAANGIVGLETSLSLSLTLVEKKILSVTELIKKMSTNPARILGLQSNLEIGSTADLTIIDTEKRYVVDKNKFKSLGKNTPFDGWHMKGKAVLTMAGGKLVFEEDSI